MLSPAVRGPFYEAEVAAVRQRRIARWGLAGDGNHNAQDVVMRGRGQEANERCGTRGWMEWNGMEHVYRLERGGFAAKKKERVD